MKDKAYNIFLIIMTLIVGIGVFLILNIPQCTYVKEYAVITKVYYQQASFRTHEKWSGKAIQENGVNVSFNNVTYPVDVGDVLGSIKGCGAMYQPF